MVKSTNAKGAEMGGRNPEALADALASIEKSYGKGSIMRLGDGAVVPIEGISTGSLGLDLAVGGRGFPRGRVIEIYGPESSGKTTLALHVVANAQRAGGMAAFIDAEHALDPQYARRLGVNLDELLIAQPDHGEQALDICETLSRSGSLDVIVIDSVAALVPKAEIEGEMGDTFVGLQARLMSQALRKLTGLVAKTSTMLIFINQIREKIGVMFGSPETTTGGRALKFYSSVRIDIRRIGTVKGSGVEDATGARTKATVVKNKVAPPFRKVEFDILFNVGINELGEILDLGVDCGVLRRSGTWLSYGDERLGQGRERAREFLLENREMANEIRRKILEMMSPDQLLGADSDESGPVDGSKSGDATGEDGADVGSGNVGSGNVASGDVGSGKGGGGTSAAAEASSAVSGPGRSANGKGKAVSGTRGLSPSRSSSAKSG